MSDSEQEFVDSETSLEPRTSDSPVLLTGAQRRMWDILVADLNSKSFRTIAIADRVSGPLDLGLLRTSLEMIVRRHESLRTRIVTVDGVPMQRIDSSSECELNTIGIAWPSLPESQRNVRRIAEELIQQPVDLAAERRLQATLFRLSAQEHVLLLATDHIVSDAKSAEILNREVWTLYNQGIRRSPFSLQPLDVQFPDYAVWQQRSYLMWRRQHEAYWREHLNSVPYCRLPVDYDDSGCAQASEMAHVPFGKTLSEQLRAIAQREGTLLPIVVLTIYICAMSRWCRERDLLVHFITHGRRRHSSLETMVGLLADRLNFRIQLVEQDSFLDLLQRVRLEFDSAFEHYDFDRLSCLMPECRTELAFNWIKANPTPAGARQGEDGADESIRLQRFNLRMSWSGKLWPFFFDSPAGIMVNVAYAPSVFARSTIERFGRELRSLAESFARQPLGTVCP